MCFENEHKDNVGKSVLSVQVPIEAKTLLIGHVPFKVVRIVVINAMANKDWKSTKN